MKNSLKSYILNFLLIIILTAFGLWFALKDNMQAVIETIAAIKWYMIVLILMGGIVYGICAGCVLTLMARRYNKNYTFFKGIANAFVGLFFCGITPSATGGQFAQAYIFKKQGIDLKDSASILWADFIIYQTVMMLYVTILFLMKFTYFLELIGPWLLAIVVGYLINLAVISVLWTMALLPKLYVKLSKLAVKVLAFFKIIKDKEKTLASWSYQVAAFTSEIQSLKKDKALIIKASFISFIRMSVHFALPFLIMNILGCATGFERFIDCLSLSSFVLMANAFIPVPGASGGTEVIFTQLFRSIIADSSLASGVMILWRFSTFHVLVIMGSILFICLKQYYEKRKYKETE